MHTIVLKKNVKARFIVEELAFVNLDNHIDYHASDEGVAATGQILMNGEYYNGGRYAKFSEQIDVDVFVPTDKITCRKDIQIKINDFEYTIDGDQIIFAIKVDIEGLKEDIKSFPSTTENSQEEPLLLEEPPVVNEVEMKVEEPTPEAVIVKDPVNKPIELVKNKYRQICWSYRVILKGDSYESIGNELKVDSMKLRSANRNQPLKEGMLLIIPNT